MSALSKRPNKLGTDDPGNETMPAQAVLYVGEGNRLAVKPTLQALKPYRTKDIVIIGEIPFNAARFRDILRLADSDIVEWDSRPNQYVELKHGRTITRIKPWAWVKLIGNQFPAFEHALVIVSPQDKEN